MDAKKEQLKNLLELILPTEILEYYTIINLEIFPKEVHLFIDENNTTPVS